MKNIENQILSQLFMETRFAPRKQLLRQIDSARKLYKIIDTERNYPFEFVCSKITGYRPKQTPQTETISGEDLIESLPTFILRASARLKLKADEQEEKIYSIDELAEKFSVSGRTIERWRKKGLVAGKYIFGDGIMRTGFAAEEVDEFTGENTELLKRASQYNIVTEKNRQAIIKKIIAIATDTKLSRQGVIKKAAAQSNRSVETVRCLLIDYEKQNPRKNIFKKPCLVIGTRERAIIFNMFEAGTEVEELAEKFQRSKSSIYRIISRRRIRKLLKHKPEYIESKEFTQESAQEKFLGKSLSLPGVLTGKRFDLPGKRGKVQQRYFDLIKKTPILNRQQEMELFRRYNFLKYIAKKRIESLDLAKPSARAVTKAQQLLDESEDVKAAIIEANLRLVVRIAARHSAEEHLGDLVSEGNMALMRAVEKFDYTRGFRFSTYASWVIAKDFARHLPAEAARLERTASSEIDEFEQVADKFNSAKIEAVESAHHSLEEVIADNLTEREQYIIRYHFGLVGTLVKKKSKTLKQIGDELGLSKERIRQIELIAIQKLRQTLSPKEFQLLIG
ncbi:MAG: sigma-70 family RNA polymerase sigma factor [Anaerohalosphaeraceae bacterium]|nr:sigma-70 family RNA polymerase sigma factor [Anaerohalosphaeraceae bacterium]